MKKELSAGKQFLKTINGTNFRLIILITVFLASFPSLIPKKLSIFPNNRSIHFTSFTDEADSGNSEILNFSYDSTELNFSFILHEKFNYPYAGVHTDLIPQLVYEDFSKFDRVVFGIEVDNPGLNLQIHLRSFQKNYTNINEHMTFRFLVKTINCLENYEVFKIPLREFTTPRWWFYTSKIPEKKAGPPDLSRIESLTIQNDGDIPMNQPFSFKVTSLYFERNIPARILTLIITEILLIILFGLLSFFTKFFNTKKTVIHDVIVPYEKLDISNSSADDTDRIVAFMAKNFSNPMLDLSKTAVSSGVLSKEVPTLLKNKFGLSFRQYLNTIRIAEAKRLLTETDRNISEISTAVGYTNVTHFNRVFKEFESTSPKDFRKKVKDTVDDADDEE